MGKYDTDGSGSIDFDEFLEMIKGLLKEARELDGLDMPDTDALFDQHTADRQQQWADAALEQ